MTPIHEVVATYIRAWNDTDPRRVLALLEKSCAPTVAYFDPKGTCRGVADLAARIQRSRTESPTFGVDPTSAIDGYEDTFRYTWVLVIEEAKLRLHGLDVLVRDEQGRIATLTSFFGTLETLAPRTTLRVQPRWQP